MASEKKEKKELKKDKEEIVKKKTEEKAKKDVKEDRKAAVKPRPVEKPVKDEKKAADKAVRGYDPWKVLRYPHLAEKSMNMVEFENKLTFIVRRDASKRQIKEAIERLFGVKVIKVQTEITTSGVKKAYAKLSPENSASEIASRLGMV